VLERLDAAAVRHWCAAGLDGLRRHQQEIDDLNVYPVPDGDTGTNLVLTVTSAHQALSEDADGPDPAAESTPLGRALRRMARGALLGARGNSGVILSQILRGLADALADLHTADGPALAAALRTAATAAYAAVAEPVEGTLLSVVAEAAAAAAAAGDKDLTTVVREAARGATEALARTPEQLPALARAGVVDAGGRGLVVLLDALVAVVSGERAPWSPGLAAGHRTPHQADPGDYGYEVQYLLDAPADAVTRLQAVLAGLGDSLVVVGTGGAEGAAPADLETWNVHVHVDDVGAAIEAGVEAGRPHRISVTRFADQSRPAKAPAGKVPTRSGAVVVATGAGLAELFTGEGAVVVPGPSPSTVEILEAIRRSGADRVVILPNDPNNHPVAATAAAEARAEGIRAGVVRTRSPVQAMAALAVRDPRRRFEDDMVAMAEAGGACRYAEVTVAAREAVTVAGVCQPGDILALVEGEVNLIGKNLLATSRQLLDRMLAGGGELVTLLVGEAAPDGYPADLREHLTRHWPFVEVQIYDGGQPYHPLVVGVE
jgi:DAK2 domain fusion protein YloV